MAPPRHHKTPTRSQIFSLIYSQPSQEMKTTYQESYKTQKKIEKSIFETLPRETKLPEKTISPTIDLTILKDIENTIDSDDYFIPERWPQYKPQRDHCCGLYGLATSLKFGYPLSQTPEARKDGNRKIVSLRERAKKMELTSFGEIFDVNSLPKLAASFGFKDCESFAISYESQKDYINHICSLLIRNGTVIVACDLGKNNLPEPIQGLGTHWGTIFGYYFSKGECYFLTFQYGKTFLWSGEQLYLSNLHLPEMNPKRYPLFCYYKNGMYKQSHFVQSSIINKSIINKRYVIGETLKNFKFGLCFVPIQTPIMCMDFSKNTVKNSIKIKKIR